MKITIKRFVCIVLVFLLAACGTVPPSTPTLTPAASKTSAPTFTPVPPTPTIQPTSTQSPPFPLDGYVITFVRDDDLYFQDGNSLPVKLAHVGEKYNYSELSDDNQKVVFFRNDDSNRYSINTDGTDERIVIPNDWLDSFETGTTWGGSNFIPSTHQLLLATILCKSQKWGSPCSMSLFLADTDTGKIRKLADFGLAYQQNSQNKNVKVSPDGKMVAVGTMDGVDIITLNGKIIRDNMFPYKPSTGDDVLFPSLFWLPDSSGLIVALPDTLYNDHAFHDLSAHSIWRYTIKNNIATQIPLDPSPMADTFQVSPDGNWIVYGGYGYDLPVYLGNLADGHIQIFKNDLQYFRFSWSPDSQHFIAETAGSSLGTVDVPSFAFILTCQADGEWIDAGHFTCFPPEKSSNPRRRIAEITPDGIKIYDLGFGEDIEPYVFIKPK